MKKNIFISINGNIVEGDQAKISVFNRSFLFGEGLFETMLVRNGNVAFIDQHLGRMEWSSSFIDIPFVHPQDIKDAIYALIDKSGFSLAKIKVIFSYVEDSPWPTALSDTAQSQIVIFCEKIDPASIPDFSKGRPLCTINSVKNDLPPLSNMKSTNWLSKIIARKQIAERKCFDGILLNSAGMVTECTTSNIFWVNKNEVCTPPLESGLLPGTTRQIIINIAKKKGLKVSEKIISIADLKIQPEVFITSSIMGVVPVSEIDAHLISNARIGDITTELNEAYFAVLEEETKE